MTATLVLTGTVVSVTPTRNGKGEQVVIESGRLRNHLVVAARGAVKGLPGETVTIPVNVRVETVGPERRPTSNVVFFTGWADEDADS